jgi:homoserine dehydrogenase
MLKLGLLGFGNVGQGVFELIHRAGALIKEKSGHTFEISQIGVRNKEKYQDRDLKNSVLTIDLSALVSSKDVDIVIELMGGEFPAADLISLALKHGKPVVTANKEVISKHLPDFLTYCTQYQTDILYEATVCGAIPIIRTLKPGFPANKILGFCGILNGTTNFILSKIAEEKKEFKVALKEAQELGFAEADPSMDIQGLDAAYKTQILSAVAFNKLPLLSQIYYEGIENIDFRDMNYAKELGYTIKMLGMGKRYTDDEISVKVHPTLVPITHALAGIANEMNAIFISGDSVGELMLSGKGAGSLPTASAVLSDVCEIARKFHSPFLATPHILSTLQFKPIQETESQFYVRVCVSDHPRVLEKITHILGNLDINISKILQKESQNKEAEIVIITHKVIEKKMNKAILELKELSQVHQIRSVIRVGLNY